LQGNPLNARTEIVVTEQPSARPARVGGSPAFIAAHGITAKTGLAFEHAFTLARLVLDEGGGPVPCRGKNAMIKKPAEKALMELGLISVEGSSEFTQRAYLELSIDGRISELLDAKFSGVKITPVRVAERAKWAATATQEAFNLVGACLVN
jgi:hypothetical protein